MQLESLKVFCDLAETSSFTKAAQLNQVSQSAISQQISGLERRFAGPLVERSKKNFRLTREGEVVYEFSKRILAAFQALHQQFDEIKETVSGQIRLSTFYSLGLRDLPPFLDRFQEAYPAVKVQIEYRQARQVYDDVLGNGADLGVVAYPQPKPALEVVPLRREPLVLICPSSSALAKSPPLRLKALQGCNFILFGPDIPTRRAIEQALKAADVKVKMVMASDNIETVRQAVAAGAGVAIVPEPALAPRGGDGSLVEVKLEGRELFRPIALLYRSNKVLSPAMKKLVTALQGKESSAPPRSAPMTESRLRVEMPNTPEPGASFPASRLPAERSLSR